MTTFITTHQLLALQLIQETKYLYSGVINRVRVLNKRRNLFIHGIHSQTKTKCMY